MSALKKPLEVKKDWILYPPAEQQCELWARRRENRMDRVVRLTVKAADYGAQSTPGINDNTHLEDPDMVMACHLRVEKAIVQTLKTSASQRAASEFLREMFGSNRVSPCALIGKVWDERRKVLVDEMRNPSRAIKKILLTIESFNKKDAL